MSSVDERIVNMKFNNSQFESGVKQSVQSIGKLKDSLNLDSSKKSLSELDAAGKKFDLSGISSSVEAVGSKFSALGIIAIGALASIGAKAVSAGAQLVRSFSIDPIMEGLSNYETKINSIQTILANTQSKGTTLSEVTKALAELNTYANQTVYNFADMTKNIGTFTAAGVDLKTSVSSIKGIANLAAMSGSSSQQASTAMYQLSQAIATGTVKLMDWNSVVNAGMGGKAFQDQLIQTAKVHGVQVDAMIKKDGSFRDSLQEGWLTSQILTETLNQYTGDLSESQLKSMGYSEQQAQQILATGKAANDSATKIRTVTQLSQALGEEVGTAWANVWEALIGDINQATDTLSAAHNVLENILTANANHLAELLKGWDKLGGRAKAVDAISNAFKFLVQIVSPIKNAFTEIFPPTTAKNLYDITAAIDSFTKKLKIGASTSDEIKRTFKGVFAIFDIGLQIVKGFFTMLGAAFNSVSVGNLNILSLTAHIGDFIVKIDNAIKSGNVLTTFFGGLGRVIGGAISALNNFVGAIGDTAKALANGAKGGIDIFADAVQNRFDGLGNFIGWMSKLAQGVASIAKKILDFFAPVAPVVEQVYHTITQSFINGLSHFDFNSAIAGVNGVLAGGILIALKKFVSSLTDLTKNVQPIGSSIKSVFGTLTDTLGSMQAKIKAGTLMQIAGAIGILTLSVLALSFVDPKRLTSSLTAITVMLGQTMTAMKVFDKMSATTGFTGIGKVTGALILLGIAMDILASAVKKLADLNWNELAKGLTGVTVGLAELVLSAKVLSTIDGGIARSAAGLVILAAALRVMASAISAMGQLSWSELAKGLTGTVVSLSALVGFLKVANFDKMGIVQGTGLLLLATGLRVIASAVSAIGSLDIPSLIKGLTGLAVVLAELALFSKFMSFGPAMIVGAGALVIMSGGIFILALALQQLSKISWGGIAKDLVLLTTSLTILVAAMALMSTGVVGAAAMVVAAGGVLVLSYALQQMGNMKWGQIGKAMTVLFGSLVLLAAGLTVMVAALPGAAALVVAAVGLGILATVLKAMSTMSWGDIGKGLGTIAAALGILAVGGVLVTAAVPGLLGLGVALTLIGAACALAGVGLGAISAAMGVFAVSGAAAGAVLVGVIQGLIGLIPYALTQFAAGLISFAGVIATGAPQFVAAFTALIISLLDAINNTAPSIISTLTNLLVLLVNAVVTTVPQMVSAGLQLITGVLNGIAQNIGSVARAGADVIIQFMNAMATQIPRVADKGADAVIKLVNGVSKALDDHRKEMSKAGSNLAGSIIAGMVEGLLAGPAAVINAAKKVATDALNAARKALDSHSPSKKFIKLGKDSDTGLAMGFDALRSDVSDSASTVATEALSRMGSVMSDVNDVIQGDVKMDPVISPVVDMSDVEKSAARMQNLLNGQTNVTLSANSTAALAASNASYAKQNQSNNSTPGTAQTGQNGSSVSFTQINNSPKPLSRIDIYRDTQTQLAKLKGALA